MAVAVIDHGKVGYVHAYGIRNAKGDPLTTDTVMYGASLTKTVFAYTVMQLVDQGKLNLDTPIKDDLDKPLPSYGPDPVFPDKYGPYKDLAGDPRWEEDHAAYVPDPFDRLQQLLVHRTRPEAAHPFRTRHALQLFGRRFHPAAIRHRTRPQGAGVGARCRRSDQGQFRPAGHDPHKPGVAVTVPTANVADGWNDQGQPQAHDKRSKVRVAGSMNTTISDLSKFAAALVRGDGLSAASRAEMTKPRLHITTAHQFPLFLPDLPVSEQRKDLYAGLGVVVFDGPQGHGFYKGGHDGQTANTMVCIEAGQRCVVILSNDVRSEAGFADLVRFILGDTGVPYDWEYGDHAGKS